jgi:hypothetical protein
MKNKANKGFLKEIAKNPQPATENKKFGYSKPVSKVSGVNSLAQVHRAKEFRSVKPDKSTSLVNEQTQALKTHKGIK